MIRNTTFLPTSPIYRTRLDSCARSSISIIEIAKPLFLSSFSFDSDSLLFTDGYKSVRNAIMLTLFFPAMRPIIEISFGQGCKSE
jgi:hypothetical protein